MAEVMALQLVLGQVELQPLLATHKEDMTRAVLPTMPSHHLKVTGVATVPLVPQLILMARHRKVCILNLSDIDKSIHFYERFQYSGPLREPTIRF